MSTEIYVVRGVVEAGDRRGRTIGFPTANLAVEPAAAVDGVWAGWVEWRDVLHVAAISVGNRATFYGEEGFRLLEAHLLDFDGNLYDQTVTVWMCAKLRSQMRFESVDALVEQLRIDVEHTAQWAASAPAEPMLDLGVADLPRGLLQARRPW